MKKILYITFILFYISINGQKIKNGIVSYRITVSEISIKKYFSTKRDNIKSKKALKFWDNYYNKSNSTKGILKFKEYNSVYELDKNLKSENDFQPNTIEIFSGGNNIFFSNYLKNENIKQDCDLLGECFLIKNSTIQWKLTQDIKLIQGFKCYKAEAIVKIGKKEVDVIAWYTGQIPVNFGPINYFGLPGLILELDDSFISYKATKILLNSKSKLKLKSPVEGIKTTEEEFINLAKKSFPKEMFKN